MLVMVVVKCLFGHSAVLVILRICHPDGTEGSLSPFFSRFASLRHANPRRDQSQCSASVCYCHPEWSEGSNPLHAVDNDIHVHYFILRR